MKENQTSKQVQENVPELINLNIRYSREAHAEIAKIAINKNLTIAQVVTIAIKEFLQRNELKQSQDVFLSKYDVQN